MITMPCSFIILTHKGLPHIFGMQKSIFLSNTRQAEFECRKSNSKNASVQLQSLLQKAYQCLNTAWIVKYTLPFWIKFGIGRYLYIEWSST
jgi:hypothetical protein